MEPEKTPMQKIRAVTGQTVTELAATLGVSYHTLHKWESAGRPMQPNSVIRVSLLLQEEMELAGVSVLELLFHGREDVVAECQALLREA